MPSYTFINHKTGEERDEILMIAEMEAFLASNPDWDVKPAAPFIGDPMRQGIRKPSEWFPRRSAKYQKEKPKPNRAQPMA